MTTGIKMSYVSNATIEGNKFAGLDTAIDMDHVNNIKAANNEINAAVKKTKLNKLFAAISHLHIIAKIILFAKTLGKLWP